MGSLDNGNMSNLFVRCNGHVSSVATCTGRVPLLENMEEEYFLQSPFQQTFYRLLASALNILGLGKRNWWGYKPIHRLLNLHGYILTVLAPICSISQFMYLYCNYKKLSFDVIGIVCSMLPINILININIWSTKMDIYRTVMENFMTKIHLRNYCTDPNQYTRQKILSVERVTRYTAYYLLIIYGLAGICWINIPVFNNIKNKEKVLNKTMQLQTCVYMWMPFDYAYNYKNWIIVHLINVYIDAVGVMILAILHCVNYMFIYHLIGHIQILKNTIKSRFVDMNMSDEEIKSRFISIIQHHSFIISVFNDVQSAIGINVTANYLFNLISDSLILYQVLNGGDILTYGTMVGAYIGELILMSFVLEEIKKQAEDLPDAVYSIPWESMAVPNQKTLIIILARAQAGMEFIALGGLKAGVQPMISILKTTFSYYVMLKNSIESR